MANKKNTNPSSSTQGFDPIKELRNSMNEVPPAAYLRREDEEFLEQEKRSVAGNLPDSGDLSSAVKHWDDVSGCEIYLEDTALKQLFIRDIEKAISAIESEAGSIDDLASVIEGWCCFAVQELVSVSVGDVDRGMGTFTFVALAMPYSNKHAYVAEAIRRLNVLAVWYEESIMDMEGELIVAIPCSAK
jgi:hypothetical protein